MQVTIEKQYPVAAEPAVAWQLLCDMNELASCMPGAQITERVDATHYKGSVKVKVGPANAAFAGDIEVLSLDEATRSVRMLGKGADRGGSSASMALTATLLPAVEGACTLVGKADVTVNGKFAQFGGRMMNSVSDVLLAQFADTFSQKAQALQSSRREEEACEAFGGGVDGATTLAGAQTVLSGEPEATAAPKVEGPAPKELNALALLWGVLRHWLAGLFGRNRQG